MWCHMKQFVIESPRFFLRRLRVVSRSMVSRGVPMRPLRTRHKQPKWRTWRRKARNLTSRDSLLYQSDHIQVVNISWNTKLTISWPRTCRTVFPGTGHPSGNLHSAIQSFIDLIISWPRPSMKDHISENWASLQELYTLP